jgi:hypothetical protein
MVKTLNTLNPKWMSLLRQRLLVLKAAEAYSTTVFSLTQQAGLLACLLASNHSPKKTGKMVLGMFS